MVNRDFFGAIMLHGRGASRSAARLKRAEELVKQPKPEDDAAPDERIARKAAAIEQ